MVNLREHDTWMKDVDMGIVSHASATNGDDGPWLQVCLTGKKKVAFDIVTENSSTQRM